MARLTDPTPPGVLLGAPLYVSVGKTYLPSVYLRGPTGHKVSIREGRNEISFFMLLQGGLRLSICQLRLKNHSTVLSGNIMGLRFVWKSEIDTVLRPSIRFLDCGNLLQAIPS